MKIPALLALILMGTTVSPVVAAPLSQAEVDGFLSKLGADNHYDPTKGVDWSVLPGPFYTPTLKLGLGTAIAGLYRVDPDDTTTQNSSISFTGFVSNTRIIQYASTPS